MITILLFVTAVTVMVLRQFGIIKNPLLVFLISTIIMLGLVFAFKEKINCPFAKKCPHTVCPLNKSE